jgi:hypothetical protein
MRRVFVIAVATMVVGVIGICACLIYGDDSSPKYLEIEGITQEEMKNLGLSILPPNGKATIASGDAEESAIGICGGSVTDSALANRINFTGPQYSLVWVVTVKPEKPCGSHSCGPAPLHGSAKECPDVVPERAAIVVDARSDEEGWMTIAEFNATPAPPREGEQ